MAEREISPAQINSTTKVVRRMAVREWVCARHEAMLDRELRIRELEGEIRHIESRLRKIHPSDPRFGSCRLPSLHGRCMTKCGLIIDEQISPGAVVQKPGVTWPLRRCKRCWPDEAETAYNDDYLEQIAA